MEVKALFLGKVCDTWDWKEEPECDFPHLFVDLPNWFRDKHFTRWFHPELPGLLRKEDFDVLVIGGYFMPSLILAAMWCIKNKVPYIFLCESHDRGLITTWWRRLLRRMIV